MTRTYSYVGPSAIRERAAGAPAGTPISSAADFTNWVEKTQQPNPAGMVAVTFVVDEQGTLLVADRRSEHISCSGCRPVLAAGEMFFRRSGVTWLVAEVSNQSTGFCPGPESWPAVAAALGRAGIPHPSGFTHVLVFRRCPSCGERNVVKDGWFACGVCGGGLPAEWNFSEGG